MTEAREIMQALVDYIRDLHYGHAECVVCHAWKGHAATCEFGHAQAWLSRVEQSAAPAIQPEIETAGEEARPTPGMLRFWKGLAAAETKRANDATAELSALRSKLEGIERETIERCAAWHELQAEMFERSGGGPRAQMHRKDAAYIRALKTQGERT